MATLRVEFIKASSPPGGIPEGATATSKCISEKELAIGSTATPTADQAVAPAGASHVVLFAVGGACYVDYDGHKLNTAAPGTAPRFYIPANQGRTLTGFKAGAKFACIQASIS